VAIGHYEVSLNFLNVKGNSAETLYGVDTKQDAASPAKLAYAQEIET
jgi:hypothetical protein